MSVSYSESSHLDSSVLSNTRIDDGEFDIGNSDEVRKFFSFIVEKFECLEERIREEKASNEDLKAKISEMESHFKSSEDPFNCLTKDKNELLNANQNLEYELEELQVF